MCRIRRMLDCTLIGCLTIGFGTTASAQPTNLDLSSSKTVAFFDRARLEAGRLTIESPVTETAIGTAPPQTALPPSPLPTKDSPLQILPGTRVRLRLGSQKVVGTVLDSDAESVTIAGPANSILAVPRARVTKVEVMNGRKGHWLAGAIVGASLGALIGALETPGCAGGAGDCYTRGENIGYGILGFGIVGTLVGALYKTDEWVEVPHDAIRATADFKHPSMAMSFAWRY